MAKIVGVACDFLEGLQRYDLAMLLKHCHAALVETEIDNGFFKVLIDQAIVEAPKPIDEALKRLPQQDRKRISEAVASAYAGKTAPDDITIKATDAAVRGSALLLAELLIHRDMMIDVATGGPRIQEVDDYYRAREIRIRQAIPDGVRYENPHDDLWDWYRHWSAGLPQYRDRRFYIRELFGPAIDAISKRSSLPSEPREPTGWERVDRALSKARTQLETASAEEDCQAIGLLCREIIISLAQAVYDPAIHESLDGARRIYRTCIPRREQQGSQGTCPRIAGVGAKPTTPPNRNPAIGRTLCRSGCIDHRRNIDHCSYSDGPKMIERPSRTILLCVGAFG